MKTNTNKIKQIPKQCNNYEKRIKQLEQTMKKTLKFVKINKKKDKNT